MWQKIKENAPELIAFAKSVVVEEIPSREVDGFCVPVFWSDNAAMICRTRYARKPLAESSAAEVCARMVKGWADAGVVSGHIIAEDHEEFQHLLTVIMLFQLAAPNSPQWFNSGVYAAGMRSDSTGNYVYRPDKGAWQPEDAYEYPQVHACFIQSVNDSMLGDGGIMSLWDRETTVFKHGSGSGSNISAIREKGAPLSGGGTSSGVMSFLSVGDKNAGAIKSGGTNRRAALMRTMDGDHPDIIEFIRWKRDEEAKVAYLAEGSKVVVQAVKDISEGKQSSLSPAINDRIRSMIDNGIIDGQFNELDTSWTSEAYATVDGQNSNNSVMLTDAFVHAVKGDGDWELTSRVNGDVVKTVKARDIWREICESAWLSADPAVQFYDAINSDNTAANTGAIHATNPCVEFMYLDDHACNLASINLAAKIDGKRVSLEIVQELAYVMTVVLDITVDMASYPTELLAQNAYEHRTLGLGFTGLGELLARRGIAYGSERSAEVAGEIQGEIFSHSLRASQDMAAILGACEAYAENKEYVERIYSRKSRSNSDEKVGEVRNMQLTCIAPTGTISFVMDAGSTGIEPVFALSTWKTLAEGGGMNIVAPFVDDALIAIGVSVDKRALFCESVNTGAPDFSILGDLEDEARAVLATADSVSSEGHLRVMEEVQKYTCGAISKTINLPNSATVDDISDVYMKAFDMGLKAVSVYRDGSKLSQPLNAGSGPDRANGAAKPKPVATEGDRGVRVSLPSKRSGYTQKGKIDNQSIYIRTGEYEDGTIGEIFLDVQKEGSAYGGLLSAFAQAMSIGLQYGVPLAEYIDAFKGSRMEPRGFVFGHDDIKMCTSALDYIMRDLEINYGDGETARVADAPRVHDTVEQIGQTPDNVLQSVKVTGEICSECESLNVIATGACSTCRDCGATTSCA